MLILTEQHNEPYMERYMEPYIDGVADYSVWRCWLLYFWQLLYQSELRRPLFQWLRISRLLSARLLWAACIHQTAR